MTTTPVVYSTASPFNPIAFAQESFGVAVGAEAAIAADRLIRVILVMGGIGLTIGAAWLMAKEEGPGLIAKAIEGAAGA